MVDAAAWAGASAIKLQTLEARTLVADSARRRRTSTPPRCASSSPPSSSTPTRTARWSSARAQHGLAVLSTPFAKMRSPMLEPLGLDAYKIASGDLTYHAPDRRGRAHRPAADPVDRHELAEEISTRVEVAREAGASDVAVLHCVSAYPTPVASQNLRAITTLADSLPAAGRPVRSRRDADAGSAGAGPRRLHLRAPLVLEGDDQAIDRAVSSTPPS